MTRSRSSGSECFPHPTNRNRGFPELFPSHGPQSYAFHETMIRSQSDTSHNNSSNNNNNGNHSNNTDSLKPNPMTNVGFPPMPARILGSHHPENLNDDRIPTSNTTEPFVNRSLTHVPHSAPVTCLFCFCLVFFVFFFVSCQTCYIITITIQLLNHKHYRHYQRMMKYFQSY